MIVNDACMYASRPLSEAPEFHVKSLTFDGQFLRVEVMDYTSLRDIEAALEVSPTLRICIEHGRWRRRFVLPSARVVLELKEVPK